MPGSSPHARVSRQRRGAATAALAVALALAAVFADEPARWLVAADQPRPADAAVVLAGDPDYGPTEIREQIRGNDDGGGVGFCLWNAGNRYTDGVDYTP